MMPHTYKTIADELHSVSSFGRPRQNSVRMKYAASKALAARKADAARRNPLVKKLTEGFRRTTPNAQSTRRRRLRTPTGAISRL